MEEDRCKIVSQRYQYNGISKKSDLSLIVRLVFNMLLILLVVVNIEKIFNRA